MKVALGTIEVDDETRKKIRAELGEKGHAKRTEVKDFILDLLHSKVLPGIGNGTNSQPGNSGDEGDEVDVPRGPEEAEDDFGSDLPATTWTEPSQGEGTLPEPTTGGTSTITGTTGTGATGTAGTTPTSGNLGSDGTSGGTV